MKLRCTKCGAEVKVQLNSPFMVNYVCSNCGVAFHEIKDGSYPFKAMNKRKIKRWL